MALLFHHHVSYYTHTLVLVFFFPANYYYTNSTVCNIILAVGALVIGVKPLYYRLPVLPSTVLLYWEESNPTTDYYALHAHTQPF